MQFLPILRGVERNTADQTTCHQCKTLLASTPILLKVECHEEGGIAFHLKATITLFEL